MKPLILRMCSTGATATAVCHMRQTVHNSLYQFSLFFVLWKLMTVSESLIYFKNEKREFFSQSPVRCDEVLNLWLVLSSKTYIRIKHVLSLPFVGL